MTDQPAELPRAARRVATALAERGHTGAIRLLDDSAHSAAEAARALNVDPEQIVKSLLFRGRESARPILALVGGRSRVDLERLAAHVGEPVERPDADWVREQTGFAIGGVPPVGHDDDLLTVAEASLALLPELWAAAGTPRAVFPLRGNELAALTGAQLATIAIPAG